MKTLYLINLQKRMSAAGHWSDVSKTSVITCEPHALQWETAQHYVPIKSGNPGFRVRVREVTIANDYTL
ncbi:MAG: hypothetical protein ACTHKB_11535 [Burkholderiaceae bacterium]